MSLQKKSRCAAVHVLLLIVTILLPLAGCKNAKPVPASEQTVSAATPTPSSTPFATPSPTPAPTPTPTPSGLLGGRFPELLTDEATETEQSFGCRDFFISVRTLTDDEHKYCGTKNTLTYHIADVYVQDASLIRTGCAGETFHERWTEATTNDMAQRYGAILAVSGDYFIHYEKNVVLRNGELIWDNLPKRDICVLYSNGTVKTYSNRDYAVADLVAAGAWQIWSFGPSLLTPDGQPKDTFASDVTAPNPRCVFGYYEPGHYCFVLVDGRIEGYSDGIALDKLSQLMYDLGCTVAYNLDGGGSAQMQWKNQMYNRQRYSPRPMSDIIYIAYPDAQ